MADDTKKLQVIHIERLYTDYYNEDKRYRDLLDYIGTRKNNPITVKKAIEHLEKKKGYSRTKAREVAEKLFPRLAEYALGRYIPGARGHGRGAKFIGDNLPWVAQVIQCVRDGKEIPTLPPNAILCTKVEIHLSTGVVITPADLSSQGHKELCDSINEIPIPSKKKAA